MDINKINDPRDFHRQPDLKNTILFLDDRIKELEKKFSSLDNSNNTETNRDKLNEQLISENKALNSNDKEFRDILKELKISNDNLMSELSSIVKRVEAIEANRISPSQKDTIVKIQNIKEKPYVKVSFDKITSLYVFMKKFKNINGSNEKDYECKIFDIAWFSRNMFDKLENFTKIEFNDVEVIDINKTIEISHELSIDSKPETALNLKNQSKLIINHKNVKMHNINICKCNYGFNYLIDVKSGSYLEMNRGHIMNNSGGNSIFHVGADGTLNLNAIIFSKNVQWNERTPSCIKVENEGNVSICNCQFLNHTSNKYPYSAYLIRTNGDLNIESSLFDNNNSLIQNFRCIEGNNIKSKRVFLNTTTFMNCSSMVFRHYNSIIIRYCYFHNNSVNDSGGCFLIEESKSIEIELCEFNSNFSYLSGGAICIRNCVGENSIKNCLFQENNSPTDKIPSNGGSDGGAVSLSGACFKILNSTFIRNRSQKMVVP